MRAGLCTFPRAAIAFPALLGMIGRPFIPDDP
jgi:hypothetical protein